MTADPLIFDGHNDALLKLHTLGGPSAAEQFLRGMSAQLDVPKARKGGFCGGFFAIYVPTEGVPLDFEAMKQDSYDLPLPDLIPQQAALPIALKQAATLIRLEALGALKICRTVQDIRAAMSAGTIAAIMHMEGAEAIDEDLYALEVFYHAGLRSIGPVWSRPTIYGHGVPFRFPSDGDIGPGLTDAGVRLVERCDKLGVMIDVSHLNEAGFWDVEKISQKPLVATHSNAYELCAHSRNLTDKQLAAIRERQGMVGLNYGVCFLRPDGKMIADVSIERAVDQIAYMIDKMGENCVGLGSDFDGAVMPEEMPDAAHLGVLRAAMARRGFGEALIAKICHGNWLSVLERSWR